MLAPTRFFVLILILTSWSSLQAQTNRTWYVAADAGVALEQSATWATFPSLFGDGWTRVHARFDPGYRVDLRMGHQFTNGLSLEFETGVMDNSMANASELFLDPSVQMDVYQIPLLLNGVYNFGTWHGLSIFVGLGAGASISLLDASALEAGTRVHHLRYDPTLAVQGLAGLRYQVRRNVSIDLLYKCFYAQNYDWILGGIVHEQLKNSLNHQIGVGLNVQF